MRRMLVAVAYVGLVSSALAAHHANAVFDLGKRLSVGRHAEKFRRALKFPPPQAAEGSRVDQIPREAEGA